MKRLNVLASTLAAAFALALPGVASAGFVWTEQAPGAGDLLATAQATYDSAFNTLDTISGALTNTTGAYEVDLFRIRIADPAAFSATVHGDPLDFALFLFDEAGLGVFMSDDNPSYMHAKIYLFSKTKNLSKVTMVCSCNPTYTQARVGWNDMYTWVGDSTIYDGGVRYGTRDYEGDSVLVGIGGRVRRAGK